MYDWRRKSREFISGFKIQQQSSSKGLNLPSHRYGVTWNSTKSELSDWIAHFGKLLTTGNAMQPQQQSQLISSSSSSSSEEISSKEGADQILQPPPDATKPKIDTAPAPEKQNAPEDDERVDSEDDGDDDDGEGIDGDDDDDDDAIMKVEIKPKEPPRPFSFP